MNLFTRHTKRKRSCLQAVSAGNYHVHIQSEKQMIAQGHFESDLLTEYDRQTQIRNSRR